jgi:hypothetical protein
MSPQPIHSSVSPLRRRMLEDMAMRGLREETQRDYIRFVRSFAAFPGRPPETATADLASARRDNEYSIGMAPNGLSDGASKYLNIRTSRRRPIPAVIAELGKNAPP